MSPQQSPPFSPTFEPTAAPVLEPALPSAVDAAPVARPGHPRAHAWLRLAGTPAAITLLFDAAVFGAMAVLGWKLLMPWSDALSAGESLMAIGLLVCTGLWASIFAEDLYRWRKLCRRWSAAWARRPAPAAVPVPQSADPSTLPAPRVRSLVRPTRLTARARKHSPWQVASRVDFSGPGGLN